MNIIYEKDLLNLNPIDYKNVEMVNCYININNKYRCLNIIRLLINVKSVNVYSYKTCELLDVMYIKLDKYWISTNLSENIMNQLKISNFGYENFFTKDKKLLVILKLSFCEKECNNCMSCFNKERLTTNSQIEILIINAVGVGNNVLLNNLPYGLLHLRLGGPPENYNIINLPFSLKKLELHYTDKIDYNKIKLPIDCEIIFLNNLPDNYEIYK